MAWTLRLQLLVTAVVPLLQPDVDPPSTPLMIVLTRIRNFSDQYPAPYILWTLFFSAVVATITMMIVCPGSQRQQRDVLDIFNDEDIK